MNSQQAREFRERWQAVEVVEAEEQRTTPIALRWQQTNAGCAPARSPYELANRLTGQVQVV
jgi:hypothetical protein